MKKISLLLPLLLTSALAWAGTITLKPNTNTTTTLVKGNIYYLNAISDETPTTFSLTTGGTTADEEVTANLVIQTRIDNDVNRNGDIVITLSDFRIIHKTPILIYGHGTVTFKIESTSQIFHDAQAGGITIEAPDATVNFQIASEKNLYVGAFTAEVSSVNLLPISAKNLSITGGRLLCYAMTTGDSAYGDDYPAVYPLTPCIKTETLTVFGANTEIQLSVYVASKVAIPLATAQKQRSPIIYTTLNYTNGSVVNKATTFPTSTGLASGTRYNYPNSSYATLIDDAAGGTIIGTTIEATDETATFTFPDWTVSGCATDYIACVKSSTKAFNPTPDAISIDAEKKTITINTSLCPEPELVYTNTGSAGAAALFGASEIPTAEGIDVAYAFGIDRIEVVNGEIQLRAAVNLPNEADETTTKLFYITVTADDTTLCFTGNLTFTRVESSTRFQSALIPTKHYPRQSGSTSHKYRITASEAVSEQVDPS